MGKQIEQPTKGGDVFASGKSVFSCHQLLCFLLDYFIKAKMWMQMSEQWINISFFVNKMVICLWNSRIMNKYQLLFDPVIISVLNTWFTFFSIPSVNDLWVPMRRTVSAADLSHVSAVAPDLWYCWSCSTCLSQRNLIKILPLGFFFYSSKNTARGIELRKDVWKETVVALSCPGIAISLGSFLAFL